MKKNILLLFSVSYLVMEVQSQSESNNLSDAEKGYILSKFNTEVKYNFVFYNDLSFDWDSLCQATLPILTATKTYDEYVAELQKLCTKLGDGHTNIYADNPNDKDYLQPLPIHTKRLGNQVFVEEIRSSKFKEQGVDRGVELLEIDGMSVFEFADKNLVPYLASSTTQWTAYAPFANYDLTKDKRSKVTKLLFKNRKEVKIEIVSGRTDRWDLIDKPPVLTYKVLDNNIGYLKIRTFMGNDFIKEFDKIYEEIIKTDGLIIDLRDNTGGNSNLADYITRHLSTDPIKMGKWSSRMYVAAHGSWNYPQEWYMQTPHDLKPIKDKEVYTKPINLLVNAVTFSSSENFCVTFRGMNRGKIIGTTTGGSTGNPIIVSLGHGIYAGICTKDEWDTQGNKFIGIGIKPDIEVEETSDVYTTGKDVVIETALRSL